MAKRRTRSRLRLCGIVLLILVLVRILPTEVAMTGLFLLMLFTAVICVTAPKRGRRTRRIR